MKVDKGNPLHWFWLARAGVVIVVALLLRTVTRRARRKLVFLYGHKLNGNLKALYDQHAQQPVDGEAYPLRFLTLDRDYHRALTAAGIRASWIGAFGTIGELARCAVVVSDHGLHALVLALRCSNMVFVDVWHGIPFKGFDADDFRVQHRYTEVWVASPLLRQMYIERFGFPASRVVATGYARTDRLVAPARSTRTVHGLPPGVPGDRTLVMIAPTWKQDDARRNVFPFGFSENEFLRELELLGQECGCNFLLRMHLNVAQTGMTGGTHVALAPAGLYPDTEELLLHSDVLVSDWSSVVFDFLLLNRPAIFLDVPAPFAKGFALGPDYRYGEVVADREAFLAAIREAVRAPAKFMGRHAERYVRVREEVYGNCADGRAGRRCLERLRRLVDQA